MNQVDEVYLDNNASTQPLDAVVEAVASTMRELFGNPSSAHSRGSVARHKLIEARETVASFLGAKADQIIFTSGGTEGNNTVLFGVLRSDVANRLVTTVVEHASVLRPAEEIKASGTDVVYLPVDGDGRIDCNFLEETLSAPPSTLISIQWVNSETGVIQPIEDIAKLVRTYDALLHIDAAQAVGRLPININSIHVDFLTFSGHKLHGPLGTGVLYIRDPRYIKPLLFGGGQENGWRAGTENLPGIVGLAQACEVRANELTEAINKMQKLRDRFEKQILANIPDVTVNGASAPRVCNTTNIRFSGLDGQALLARLDRLGVFCSQASACSSHRPEPSHVLRAMGLSEEDAFASLRFSFSVLNTEQEVERAVKAIRDSAERLRAILKL